MLSCHLEHKSNLKVIFYLVYMYYISINATRKKENGYCDVMGC